METLFKNLIQLVKYFKDEETCKSYLAEKRWGNTPSCPHCGNTKAYLTNRGYKCAAKECHKKFTVTTGTIFENTKISLQTWFAAMYLCTAHKKGISSLQLSRDLNITQKTAWFVLHRIREMLTQNAPELLNGEVEIDETFLGGKDRNRHADKKKSGGKKGFTHLHKDKTMVGAIERGGKVITKHVADRSKESIHPFLLNTVAKGATLYSDEYHAYKGFEATYNQQKVNHSQKEYVRGNIHTNGIENYWSTLKRGIYGIYHQISTKHTQRYLDEFAYRFNTRKDSDTSRFEDVFYKVDNARIT
jgi:transposase-like protein